MRNLTLELRAGLLSSAYNKALKNEKSLSHPSPSCPYVGEQWIQLTGAQGSQHYFGYVGTSPREREREKNGIIRLKGPGPDPLPNLPLLSCQQPNMSVLTMKAA